MNIVGTGLSGLVGSRVIELLSPDFRFENLSLETGVDITDAKLVEEKIFASNAPWVFHFAAKTDVDGAEVERSLGEKSSTWIVNVATTEHIAEICKRAHKHVLYISTDYVFDGTADFYSEEDKPNPQGWYAQTKYEGERRIAALGELGLIVRIANPYRAKISGGKPDFVHKIADRLQKGEGVVAPSDQLFVPTFIDDLALALQLLVQRNASGIYHVVGADAVSPFEAARQIAAVFGYAQAQIESTTFSEYFKNRAPRPFHAVMKNDRIEKFGAHMRSFSVGLQAVKLQEMEKK